MFKGKSTQIFQADQFPLSGYNLYQIADCNFLVAGSYFTTEGNWPTSKMSTKGAQLLSRLLNFEKFNFNQSSKRWVRSYPIFETRLPKSEATEATR